MVVPSPSPRESRHPRKSGEDSRARIKHALRTRKEAGGRSPTIEELADETGLAKSTVQHHLDWMLELGQIRIEESRREIVLLDETRP